MRTATVERRLPEVEVAEARHAQVTRLEPDRHPDGVACERAEVDRLEAARVEHDVVHGGVGHVEQRQVAAVEAADVIELTKDDIKTVGKVDAGLIYIDSVGKSSDPIDEPIIRDRKALSEEGVVVIMAVASQTKPSVEVITRGVAAGGNGVTAEIERLALEALTRGVREKRSLQDIRDDVFYPVRRYFRKATGRNPLILPTVLEG